MILFSPVFLRWLAAFLFSGLALATAAESFPRYAPVPPAEAASTFRVRHGFSLDLIAAEPAARRQFGAIAHARRPGSRDQHYGDG